MVDEQERRTKLKLRRWKIRKAEEEDCKSRIEEK